MILMVIIGFSIVGDVCIIVLCSVVVVVSLKVRVDELCMWVLLLISMVLRFING